MSTEIKKKGKTAGYSNEVLHAKRDAKRCEAEERNAKWSALDPDIQLGILTTRPGKSARQVARIKARL